MRNHRGGAANRRAGVTPNGSGVPRTCTPIHSMQRVARSRSDACAAERGAVTAEVAVALPALVVLLALLLGTAHVGMQQLRLEEAARAGAREVMRGESPDAVQRTAERMAGEDAVATVSAREGWTVVEVRTTVDGPLTDLLDLDLSASATGRTEQDG